MLKTSSSQSSRYFTLCYFIHLHYMHIYLYSYFRLSTSTIFIHIRRKTKTYQTTPTKYWIFAKCPEIINGKNTNMYSKENSEEFIVITFIHFLCFSELRPTKGGLKMKTSFNASILGKTEWLIEWNFHRNCITEIVLYNIGVPMLPNNFELWWGK